MRITTSQYAKVLYELTENKNQAEISGVVANFLKVLKKNNQLKLAGKIIEKFSEVYNAKNGIVEANVTSASELDEKTLQEVENFVTKKYAAQKVILSQKVDKNIKGGTILQIGDEMVDASVSRKLRDLEKSLR